MTAERLAIQPQRSLQELAYGRLREAILDGSLQPGARLIETDLSTRMGISRSPLREAVRRLSQEGLVTVEPRRGARVAEAAVEYDDLFEVREALEVVSIRRAAQRVEAEQLEALRVAHARMERAVESGQVHAIVRADADFHRQLLLCGGNPILDATLSSLLDRIQRARLVIHHQPGNSRQALAEHRAMLEAVAAGDARRAVAAMQGHMAAARRRLKAGLAGPAGPVRGRRARAERAGAPAEGFGRDERSERNGQASSSASSATT